jgi:hypothetical protein
MRERGEEARLKYREKSLQEIMLLLLASLSPHSACFCQSHGQGQSRTNANLIYRLHTQM